MMSSCLASGAHHFLTDIVIIMRYSVSGGEHRSRAHLGFRILLRVGRSPVTISHNTCKLSLINVLRPKLPPAMQ